MTERIRILNRQREDTGIRKGRDEIHDGDFVEVIHLWVQSPEGRHLLQKRSASKALFPGAWDSAAAGAVIAGETPACAAVREIAEELGIQAQEEDLVYLFTAEFEMGFDDYFLLIIPETTPLEILEEEVSLAEWFDTEDVLSFIEDGLFTEHEGTWQMEERLRESLFQDLLGETVDEISFHPANGVLLLRFHQKSVVFEGVSTTEGSLHAQGGKLSALKCSVKGKRQRWKLTFPSTTFTVDAARAERRDNEDICPICGEYLRKGAVYADQQINWTPEGTKVGVFSRPTRWSMGKDDIKLADYFIPKKARFPLDYCMRCNIFLTEKKK